MSKKLKPCPFCGGRAGWYFQEKAMAIGCTDCPARIAGDNEQEIIKRWNSRPKKINIIIKLINKFKGDKQCHI